MQKTLQELTNDTEQLLHQAAGISVQVYAQDHLHQLLNEAFDHIFTTEYWPSFIRREVRTLNGTSGTVTVPFALISEWKDVQSIFRRNSQHPIPEMPLSFNLLDLPDGSTIRFVEGRTDTLLFTAYPLDAVDDVVVVGRERPPMPFIHTDTVPFDHMALEYYAAWSYLVDDASNAGAAQKMQGLFDTRIKELRDSEHKNVVSLNPRSGQIPTQWN